MSLAPVAGGGACTIIKRRWRKIEIGFCAAQRVPPPFASPINSLIPNREREFAFSNVKDAASAFGTSSGLF
jgi:hypothetical protein